MERPCSLGIVHWWVGAGLSFGGGAGGWGHTVKVVLQRWESWELDSINCFRKKTADAGLKKRGWDDAHRNSKQ